MSELMREKCTRPSLRVASIGQHRQGEFQLGIANRIGLGAGFRRWHRIVGGIEPVGIRRRQVGDGSLGARVVLAPGDPQRRKAAIAIERLDCRAFGFADEQPVALVARNSRSFSATGTSPSASVVAIGALIRSCR